MTEPNTVYLTDQELADVIDAIEAAQMGKYTDPETPKWDRWEDLLQRFKSDASH